MVKRANKRDRENNPKRERKVILIAVEGGNKTERNYFVELNRRQGEYHINFADGNSTDPANVVEDAINSALNKGIDYLKGDKVYAVLDTDFGKEKQIEDARRRANRENVEMILSNPCFEIWLLQHFRYSTGGYNSGSEVLKELTEFWPGYRKNLDSFQDLYDKTELAIKNSNDLIKFHDSVNQRAELEYRNPSTDVYKLMQLIILGYDDTKE